MLYSLSTQTARDVLQLAFRASYLNTFDGLIQTFEDRDQQLPKSVDSIQGFLAHIPLVAGCTLQVQLDQLFRTWRQLSSLDAGEISDIDHCVCYCAASYLAQLGEHENQRLVNRAAAGMNVDTEVDFLWLASKLRTMQITWPFLTDSAAIVRDHYLVGDRLDRPAAKPIERCSQRDAMLELVGRWTVSPDILSNASGLLTEHETQKLGEFFANHPELMNLR